MKSSTSIDINAPVSIVFKHINDSDSLMHWVPNLVENEVLTSTDAVVGSKFRQAYLENGRRMEMEGEVIAYEADKYLACEIRGKAFDLIVDYKLEPKGEGTRLTQNSEVLFKSAPMKIIGTLLKPLMAKASRNQQQTSFAKLKELAES